MKKLWLTVSVFILLFAIGCGKEQNDQTGESGVPDREIVISGKKWTEQYILPHILGKYIESKTDYQVEVKEGLGPTPILTQALKDGDIDIYVDYTGTGLLTVLKGSLKPEDTKETVYERVKTEYKKQYNLVWTQPLGFNNTNAITLRKERATELGVETASDLAAISDQLTFGADPPFFEREDGYKSLVKTYGFKFKDTMDLDTNIKYAALNEKKVDVINAFTTDGFLPRFDLKVVKDDQNLFPPYYAAPIVRQETLDQFPELEKTLNELADKIDENTMAKLNARVDIDRESPDKVAEEFLKEAGLIQ
ncbi:glycine/betaine ABC transporter substrate-binding protein [Hazenella sp. IB182353]|uniref:glycine betaine ABC transporter substrate-binding protein n=1 Tax=Polycladospora coralii TaxID=2771432 RepID=UPI0017470D66|nr:glycine betaine ABC transporter substrate-binding protein [Polycladospora coralii]MBS7530800.1 glycine/betaine ABC transporter substrate-binding protein [Polycladospora coralii]